MKKILFQLAVLTFSLAACDSTPKYTINGTVEGEQTGTVYLLKLADRDTLAKAAVTDGKFSMEGTVEGTVGAALTVEGKRGFTQIFLENAAFTASLNPADPMKNSVEGGGASQSLANQFNAIEKDAINVQSELRNRYVEANQAQDTAEIRSIMERLSRLGSEVMSKTDSLIKANPDSYVSAYVLSTQMGGMELEQLSEKYNALGENAKASEPGKRIAARIEKEEAVAIGKVAPDFTLNTPEDEPLSMHSIKGKVKLIDFWASWCGPCRGENPNVVKVYEEFHPKGLEILSVSLDDNKEAWLKAIKDDNLTWNHVSDLKGWDCEAARLYGVNAIPHLIVLDENNVIVAKNLRGNALREKVAELLK